MIRIAAAVWLGWEITWATMIAVAVVAAVALAFSIFEPS